jgi:peptidoglycan hydrolase CwlO-like protein
MNHPNVPVPESWTRRAGFSPAFRLPVILAVAVLTAPCGVATTSTRTGVNLPHTRADTPASGGAVSAEIAAAEQKVADLQEQLHARQVQLSDLKAQEPSQSDKAHGSWQQQVDRLQHQIDSLKQQLAAAEKELKVLKEKQTHP